MTDWRAQKKPAHGRVLSFCGSGGRIVELHANRPRPLPAGAVGADWRQSGISGSSPHTADPARLARPVPARFALANGLLTTALSVDL